MAIFRLQKNRNYTVMSNFHLQDPMLSLKAKGLLSLMLSLPDDWDYTTKGLVAICKEGRDAIDSALKELENQKYLVRNRQRDASGQLRGTEYFIYEEPALNPPESLNSCGSSPNTDFPAQVFPVQENPTQQNTNNKQNTKYTKGTRAGMYGLCNNVKLTPEEFKSLKDAFPADYEKKIDTLSNYIIYSGRYFKSHYLTILAWAEQDAESARKRRIDPKRGIERDDNPDELIRNAILDFSEKPECLSVSPEVIENENTKAPRGYKYIGSGS